MKIEHGGKTYEFDMDSVEAHELRAVEQHTGMTYPEWGEGLKRGKVDALVAVVYTAKRRAGDELEWSDLDSLNVPELLVLMAEANGVDMEALARGEVPEMPQQPVSPLMERINRGHRAPAKGGVSPTRQRPAARKAAGK